MGRFRVRMSDGSETVLEASSREEAMATANARAMKDMDIQQQISGPDSQVPSPLDAFGGPPQQTLEQSLGAQLEAPVDMSRELPGFMLRADLMRSDKATEQARKVQASIPGADTQIVQDPVSGQPLLMIKLPGQDDYIPVDSDQDYSMGDVGDAAGGLFSTAVLGDVAGAAAPAAGLALGMTNPLALAGLGVAATAGGAAGGQAVDEGIESLRGYQDSSTPEILQGMQDTAVAAGATEGGMRVAGPLLKGVGISVPKFLGKILFHVDDQTRIAIEEAGRLGIPLTALDLHPVGRSAQMQIARTGIRGERFMLDRLELVHNKLAEFGKSIGDVNAIGTDDLERIVSSMEKDITDAIALPATKFAPGEQAMKGWGVWNALEKKNIDNLYTAARRLGPDAKYDVSRAATYARDTLSGVKQRSLRTKPGEVLPPATNAQQFLTQQATSPTPSDPVELQASLRGDLNKLLRDLSDIDPKLEGFADADATRQMQSLRTRAFNIQDDPSLNGHEKAVAARVHSLLTDSLENPTVGSPEFRRAMRRAAIANRKHEEILSKTYVRRMLNSDTPSDIGRELLNPSNVEQILDTKRALRVAGRMQDWDTIRNGFKERLRSDPSLIERFVSDPFSRRGVDLLLSKAEQGNALKVARTWGEFQTSHMVRALKKSRELGNAALQLIDEGNAMELDKLVKRLGGKNTPQGRALGAGIVQTVLDASTRFEKGRITTSAGDAVRKIEALRATGMLPIIFSQADLKKFDRMETFLSFMPSESGLGEGLVTAQMGSGAIANPVTHAPKFLNAYSRMFSNWIAGRAFMSDAMLVAGPSLGPTPQFSFTRTGATVLATALASTKKDNEQMFGPDSGVRTNPADMNIVPNEGAIPKWAKLPGTGVEELLNPQDFPANPGYAPQGPQ